MNTLLSFALAVGVVVFVAPSFAAAQDVLPPPVPVSFPSCVSPSGSVLATYSDGVHGIVGSFAVYTGSDTVYALTDGNVLQCFCPTGGITGIQTNWMNASGFSAGDISSFVSDGWMHVVSGIAWGLSDVPYLAKNISYTCSALGGGEEGSIGSYGAGGGSEEQVLGTKTGKVKGKTTTHTPKPIVAGVEIAVLPATGSSFLSLLVSVWASIFDAAFTIRL